MKRFALDFSILLISAVGIAYQIALMRVFSIAQWHHFAYMIISVAMLGFGASGALLTVLQSRLRGREPAWLRRSAFLFTLSLLGCYALSQKIPFETYQIVSQPRQLVYLFLLYIVLGLPFFLVSTCITLAFFLTPKHIARLYFFTMLGSGIGAAGVLGLLYATPPAAVPCWLTVAAAIAYLVLAHHTQRGRMSGYALLAVALAVAHLAPIQHIRISEYKALSYALLFPDARIVDERYSPLSTLTAVQSAQIRETPGQIGNYPISRYGPLPRQIGLYFDADSVSVVNEFDEANFERFTYLDYVTSALAYRFVDQPRVLVIGAGGGADVLSALWHGAAHVTAIEMDPNVLSMMRTTLRTFSGAVYDRPDVTAVLAEGRGFLASRLEEFDLIHLPLFGAFTAAAAGVYALNESYLYTLEAFKLYLSRLSERGVLSINCWLKTPPCDAIKLFATAVEALESSGIRDPAQHVVFIRSWNNATILVTRSPLSDEHVAVARKFCADRGFDLGHCPGIEPAEANQYTIMDRPIYYETAQAILSPNRETFYATYPFYVRPATDDRPYFFQFFRWDQLPRMLQDMQAQWVPFVEWGYLALVATLLQSFAASLLLVLLPLAVFARGPGHRGAKRWVLLYFAGLGVAYMFLEIAFIQKFILFLAYPVYAVAVVLVALLVFSGFGSLFAGTRQVRPATRVASAVLAMAVLAGAYQVVLPRAFDAWAAWPDAMKILATVLLLAPIAFCMGIPFPTGLQIVSDRYRSLLPWAWGINGCASVVGATLATCTAVHFGFRMVVAAALGAYVLAAIALNRLCRLLSTTQE